MDLVNIPFQVIDWAGVAPTTHTGEHGVATWRTVHAGNVRVRCVDYSAGYVADHWRERGHVLHVVEGELVTELRDGRCVTVSLARSAGGSPLSTDTDPTRPKAGRVDSASVVAVTLSAGHSYVVATGDGAHRSRSPLGARLFIVD